MERYPYGFDGVHKCDALVLHCSDFRFRGQTWKFLESLGLGSYDVLAYPGAAKLVNNASGKDKFIQGPLNMLYDKHRFETVVVINHSECGAYDETGSFASREDEKEFHKEELRKAKGIIQTRIPIEVELVYAGIEGDQVYFESVK